VDARERWQALQSRLTAARTALESGDRTRALAEVRAALELDPNFLAAVALRERIMRSGLGSEVPGSIARSEVPGSGFRVPRVQNPQNPKNPEPATRNPLPQVARNPLPEVARNPLPDAYAHFEQRARRRRVDRRLDAARQAMARRNLRAAASALDEVIALDSNLPELSDLTAEFDRLRRVSESSHRGPTIAAALAFGALVFGATWLEQGRALLSHPFAAMAPLVDARSPEPLDIAPSEEPVAVDPPALVIETSERGRHDALPPPIFTPPPPPPRTVVSPPPPVISSPAPQSTSVATPIAAPVVTPAITPPPIPVASASFAPVDVPKPSLPPPSRVESDETQIARALQQYRTAYERLDAQQAQTVWPGVNEEALARAFAGLNSQTLTFDACRTNVQGDQAVATCQGRMRYVPKIGSREPRVEPRTWTFVLKRAGADWKIDTARTDR
jgi:hypothetical protein